MKRLPVEVLTHIVIGIGAVLVLGYAAIVADRDWQMFVATSRRAAARPPKPFPLHLPRLSQVSPPSSDVGLAGARRLVLVITDNCAICEQAVDVWSKMEGFREMPVEVILVSVQGTLSARDQMTLAFGRDRTSVLSVPSVEEFPFASGIRAVPTSMLVANGLVPGGRPPTSLLTFRTYDSIPLQ